jgi:hypothetical protein
MTKEEESAKILENVEKATYAVAMDILRHLKSTYPGADEVTSPAIVMALGLLFESFMASLNFEGAEKGIALMRRQVMQMGKAMAVTLDEKNNSKSQ